MRQVIEYNSGGGNRIPAVSDTGVDMAENFLCLGQRARLSSQRGSQRISEQEAFLLEWEGWQ